MLKYEVMVILDAALEEAQKVQLKLSKASLHRMAKYPMSMFGEPENWLIRFRRREKDITQ